MDKVKLIRSRMFSGQRWEKKLNEHLILNLIREKGAIGIPEIVKISGLSRPTIDSVVNSLDKEGLIKKEGVGDPSGGRKPNLWKLNNTAGFILGIDMESPHLNIVLTDLELNIRSSSNTYFSLYEKPEVIITFLKEKIREVITRSRIEQAKLVGIGIGIPGLINKSKGLSVSIERIPNWNNVPIVQILTDEFKIPVLLENDATLMAIGEKELNEEVKDIQSLIYIVSRTGIGAGIFIDGKPYTGVYGNSGFIGHTTVLKDGPLCSCGNRGCLELFADEPAIIENAKKGYQAGKPDGMSQLVENDPGDMILEMIIQAATQGDTYARDILKEAAGYLAIGIANAVNLLDIPTILIGGNITKAGELFLKWVKEESRRKVQAIYRDNLDVRFAAINENSTPLGGAILILHDIFKDP